MKRFNICSAFQSLGVPCSKEDIIIQMAKQQNIRFNELPELQKDVDTALTESVRLGFLDRNGNAYKLNAEQSSTNATLTPYRISDSKAFPRPVNGQGDERPMGCICTTVDHSSTVEHQRLNSVCSLCGLPSENRPGSDGDNDE